MFQATVEPNKAATMSQDTLHGLSRALDDLINRLRRELRDALSREAITLSPPAMQILMLLAREPGVRMQAVAAHCGRDKGMTTRLVTALEREGLVYRGSDPDDRRAVVLTLSDAGRRVAGLCERAERRAMQHLFAGLRASEQAHLAALLRRATFPDHRLETRAPR